MPLTKILNRSRPGLLAIALFAVTVSGVFVHSGSPASSATVVTPTLDFVDLELRFQCPVSGETTFRYRPSERPPGNTTGIVTAKPGFAGDCDLRAGVAAFGNNHLNVVRSRGRVDAAGALVPEAWNLVNHFGGVRLEVDTWVEYTNGPNSLVIIYSDREPAAYTLDPATQEVTGTTGVALATSPLTATGFGAAPTFSTSGLPDGLGIDPATGVISGIPTETFGPQSITVTATNGDEEATAAVNITIESPKFTVTFHQDVGMLTRVVTVDEGQPIVLPKTQNSSGQEGVTLSGGGSAVFPIVKDYHLFGGWYSDASYAEASFVGLPGTTITPSADLTLYASWIPARDICFAQATSTVNAAVTFPPEWVTQWSMGYPTRPCTGTSGTRVRVPSDVPFELPVPTRSDAGFHGWYNAQQTTDGSSPNGTLFGLGGETHQVAFSSGSVLTYHSQWQTQDFRINFDPGSGVSRDSFGSAPCESVLTNLCGIRWNPGDALAPDGRAAVTAPSPTRDGWRFNGWFTASSGGTRLGGAGDLMALPPNTTLRAQWTQFLLNHSTGTITATRNTAITPWTVTASGFTPTIFTVAPALPIGLSLDSTSGTISGTPTALQSSSTYTITGTGADASATITVSISVDPPAPGAPLNLVATPGDRQVTLTWEPPSNASDITITTYTATGTAAGQPSATCTTAGTSCTITDLVNGATYTFTVRVTGAGNADSNAVLVTPSGSTWIPTPENTAPTPPPTRGEAQREGRTAVALTATAPAPGRLRFVAIEVEVEDEDENGGTDPDGTDPTPLATVAFEGDPSSDETRGLVARADRSVVCEVCTDLAPGTEIEVWAFSTPRRITTALVGDDGCTEFVVPLAAPMDGGSPIGPGLHTLQVVLPLEDGRLAVNVAVTVPAPPPAADAPTQTSVTWIPTPQDEQPRVPGAWGEMQREGGQPVQLAAISSRAGEVAYVDDTGMLSVVFTGDATTSVERGLVATRDGMVRCEVCGDMTPGSIVEIWAFSTPRLVAAAVVDERGCIDVMVPLSAPLDGGPAIEAGQHTLQVILPMDDGLGRLAVNVGVTVGGLTPTSLPAGEGMPTGVTGLLGMLGAALAVLVPALRRGRTQGAVGSV